jgi:hypothetical protein
MTELAEISKSDTGEPVAVAVDYYGRPVHRPDFVGGEPTTSRDAQNRKNLAEIDRENAEVSQAVTRRMARMKTPAVEFNAVEAIDEALMTLDAAATDFETNHGKPNEPLINSRNRTVPRR